MIQIAVVLLTTLALVVAGFLSFTPNFTRVVESDATRLGFDYANLRSLEEVQLMGRAGALKADQDLIDPGFFYQDTLKQEKILANATYNEDTGSIVIRLRKE